MKRKSLFAVLLAAAVLINIVIPVFADVPTPPDIHAEAGILMDLKTGRVIYSKNPDEKLYPASTTKILTAIIALEEGNLDDVVTASADAIAPITLQDSHMGILVGEQLTLDQLVNGMLIYSANDAANVIAVHIAGSLDAFAQKMNQKAKAIGAVNSNFVNPHGFHNDNHYTTASDLAAIARYAMTNDKISAKFREIVSTDLFTIQPTNKYKEVRYLSSTNHLISKRRNSYHYYPYAIGVKTGYTSQAKNCLVAAASKDGTEFLTVVLKDENTNSTDGAYTFVDTRALFDYAFENYQYQAVSKPGDILSDSKVEEAKNSVRVALTPKDEIGALLPKGIDIDNAITKDIKVNEDIQAPITKGDVLGSVSYTYNGENIGTTDLIASNDVERDTILFIIHSVVKVVTSPFLYVPVILLAVLIVVLKIRKGNNRKSRRGGFGYGRRNRYR